MMFFFNNLFGYLFQQVIGHPVAAAMPTTIEEEKTHKDLEYILFTYYLSGANLFKICQFVSVCLFISKLLNRKLSLMQKKFLSKYF